MFELPSRKDVSKCVITKETIERNLRPTLVTSGGAALALATSSKKSRPSSADQLPRARVNPPPSRVRAGEAALVGLADDPARLQVEPYRASARRRRRWCRCRSSPPRAPSRRGRRRPSRTRSPRSAPARGRCGCRSAAAGTRTGSRCSPRAAGTLTVEIGGCRPAPDVSVVTVSVTVVVTVTLVVDGRRHGGDCVGLVAAAARQEERRDESAAASALTPRRPLHRADLDGLLEALQGQRRGVRDLELREVRRGSRWLARISRPSAAAPIRAAACTPLPW